MRTGIIALLSVLLAAGCGPAERPTGRDVAPGSSSAPKRVVTAIHGELSHLAGPGSAVPGREAVADLVSAGMTNFDNRGNLIARLAETVPSVENGLWRVFADGRMETTWSIRAGARWHDGQPVRATDLGFTITVGLDRDLPEFGHAGFIALEGAEAVDERTVIVKWKRPYVDADSLFSEAFAQILPEHILRRVYEGDKSTVREDLYWTDRFVGTGPFRLREWARGSHAVLEAFDQYVLGRPKVDTIEVRFIPDSATMAANILAGEVDVTLGRTLTLEEATEVRDRWRSGRMDIGYKSWVAIFPQFIDPNPAVILDVRFRRALLHAIDRQQLADTFQGGLVPVAHSFLNPGQPQYAEIEARLPRYDYDARKAADMIEDVGYRKGPDGLYRDAENRRLEVEMRTIGVTADRAIFAVADYWRTVGVGVEPVIIPAARTGDTEYRATFPGFQIFQNPNDTDGLPNIHPSQIPLAENNYRVRSNHSRYMNPQFGALLDRFASTIPRAERTEVLGQIIFHIADQLNIMGLYYGLEPTLIAQRVENVTARHSRSTHTWNAHEWGIR